MLIHLYCACDDRLNLGYRCDDAFVENGGEGAIGFVHPDGRSIDSEIEHPARPKGKLRNTSFSGEIYHVNLTLAVVGNVGETIMGDRSTKRFAHIDVQLNIATSRRRAGGHQNPLVGVERDQQRIVFGTATAR